jgi:hypothetical protein
MSLIKVNPASWPCMLLGRHPSDFIPLGFFFFFSYSDLFQTAKVFLPEGFSGSAVAHFPYRTVTTLLATII